MLDSARSSKMQQEVSDFWVWGTIEAGCHFMTAYYAGNAASNFLTSESEVSLRLGALSWQYIMRAHPNMWGPLWLAGSKVLWRRHCHWSKAAVTYSSGIRQLARCTQGHFYLFPTCTGFICASKYHWFCTHCTWPAFADLDLQDLVLIGLICMLLFAVLGCWVRYANRHGYAAQLPSQLAILLLDNSSCQLCWAFPDSVPCLPVDVPSVLRAVRTSGNNDIA